MATLIPSETRLSEHFLLSDMIGCFSVYSRGLPNRFEKIGVDKRLTNGEALCHEALEPLTHQVGSMSISYGFISPELSREIVTYQDWRKPSHHRWDLGAAVDICPHYYLQTIAKPPIQFALSEIAEYPMSRVITYSESPYICIAVAADEVQANAPRMAFYENEFTGKKGQKPNFHRYGSGNLRQRRLKELEGVELPWRGQGYPSYHGGGKRQYHHLRCSNYTMVSDFLYDEHSVMYGRKNPPVLADPKVTEAFKVAGRVYDYLLEASGALRLSIVSAYTSHEYPDGIVGRCWRGDNIDFEIVPPQSMGADAFIDAVNSKGAEGFSLAADGDRVIVSIVRRAFCDQPREKEIRAEGSSRRKRAARSI